MFCPTCGKDNSNELKYCASCGTNLEAVTQALAGREEDFFTRMDTGMDFFIARYSEHVFKSAPQAAGERKLINSWKLLGQAVVTSMIDILLFFLMWNLLPLRAIILVISTPFRLLAQKHDAATSETRSVGAYKPPELAPAKGNWLDSSAVSVTENTTKHLQSVDREGKASSAVTGQFE